MSPEEYQRYKEAEKAHLRKLKELKKAVHTLERQKTVRSAVEKVAEGQDLLEKQKDFVDELAFETARHEARLDVALESAPDAENQARTEKLEEELQRERAHALVKQLKREMGGGGEGEEEEGEEEGDAEVPERRRRMAEPSDGPEKSVGVESARKGGTPSANPTGGRDDRPEKTIGRM